MKIKGDDQFRFTEKELKAMGEAPIIKQPEYTILNDYAIFLAKLIAAGQVLPVDNQFNQQPHCNRTSIEEANPFYLNQSVIQPNSPYNQNQFQERAVNFVAPAQPPVYTPHVPIQPFYQGQRFSPQVRPTNPQHNNGFWAFIGKVFGVFIRIFTHY